MKIKFSKSENGFNRQEVIDYIEKLNLTITKLETKNLIKITELNKTWPQFFKIFNEYLKLKENYQVLEETVLKILDDRNKIKQQKKIIIKYPKKIVNIKRLKKIII